MPIETCVIMLVTLVVYILGCGLFDHLEFRHKGKSPDVKLPKARVTKL